MPLRIRWVFQRKRSINAEVSRSRRCTSNASGKHPAPVRLDNRRCGPLALAPTAKACGFYRPVSTLRHLPCKITSGSWGRIIFCFIGVRLRCRVVFNPNLYQRIPGCNPNYTQNDYVGRQGESDKIARCSPRNVTFMPADLLQNMDRSRPAVAAVLGPLACILRLINAGSMGEGTDWGVEFFKCKIGDLEMPLASDLITLVTNCLVAPNSRWVKCAPK